MRSTVRQIARPILIAEQKKTPEFTVTISAIHNALAVFEGMPNKPFHATREKTRARER